MISGTLSTPHGASSDWGRRNCLQYGGQLRIYWTNSRGQPTCCCPPPCGLVEVITVTTSWKHTFLRDIHTVCHIITRGSQKVRFPILYPPNNFTQWDASSFTYYTSLIFPHRHLLCWGTCLGGKSISQNPVNRRWDPDHAAMFAPHAWNHHVI